MRAGLAALDDAALLRVFSFLTPLPDLFACAAVCKVRSEWSECSLPRCLDVPKVCSLPNPCNPVHSAFATSQRTGASRW